MLPSPCHVSILLVSSESQSHSRSVLQHWLRVLFVFVYVFDDCDYSEAWETITAKGSQLDLNLEEVQLKTWALSAQLLT